MRVILPLLPDPTDVIIAGMMTLAPASPLDLNYAPLAYQTPYAGSPMQGQITLSEMPRLPFPRTLVSPMSELFGSTQDHDLMVYADGVYKQPDMGTLAPYVEPAQKFTYLQTQTDSTGSLFSLNDKSVINGAEFANLPQLEAGQKIADLTLPRAELRALFAGQRKINEPSKFIALRSPSAAWYAQASERYVFAGTTENGLGVPVTGVDLYLLEISRLQILEPWPTPERTQSNGSFSIRAPRNVEYALIALKAGSPPLMGGRGPGLIVGTYSALTAAGDSSTSLGVVTVRDPTAPVSGGGGFVGAPIHPFTVSRILT